MDIAVRSPERAPRTLVQAERNAQGETGKSLAHIGEQDTVDASVATKPSLLRSYLAPVEAAAKRARGLAKEVAIWSAVFGVVTRGAGPLHSCMLQSGLTPAMARTPLQRWNSTILLDKHWSHAFPQVLEALSKSDDFESFLERFAASSHEIVVQHKPQAASFNRFGSKAIVQFDVHGGSEYFDVYGRNCHRASAAQGLAHEFFHADFALHNPFGHQFLASLHDPEFDTIKEYRTIQLENRVAESLGLRPRASHEGELLPGRGVTEAKGSCRDLAYPASAVSRTGYPKHKLRMKASAPLTFYAELVQRLPRIDLTLIHEVRAHYVKHAVRFEEHRRFLNGDHSDGASIARWQRHRNETLEMAERFAAYQSPQYDCPLPLMKPLIGTTV